MTDQDHAAKIACGLRQITALMLARHNEEESTSEAHGFVLEGLAQYADRINGFAAELELLSRNPLRIVSTDLPLEGQ